MDDDQRDIELANRGDVSGFESLYYRYRNWVYQLALRFLGGRDADALDVLQEVFLYLQGKFPGFKLSCSMRTFLYPAVKHLSIRARDKGVKFQGGDEALDLLPGGEGIGSGDNIREELAAVMAVLPVEQREVVLMRFVDEMSLKEIAEALKTSDNTVKSRLYRGLDALKDNCAVRRYFGKD